MLDTELTYFELLKEEIAKTLHQKGKVSSSNMSEWKGVDITTFQEDLMKEVNGRVSEKWFYTHLKITNNKLPRIDMLDLLSVYSGYENWANFKAHKKLKKKATTKKTGIIITVIVSVISCTAFFVINNLGTSVVAVKTEKKMDAKFEYNFCLTRMDNKPIRDNDIEILLLHTDESPTTIKCDSTGCFTTLLDTATIIFSIYSPYYLGDTITRKYGTHKLGEKIKLKTNDYALMIHYFSNSKIEDWTKRKLQLDDMIARHAKIYQTNIAGNIGMEIYNKREFINKLTMPLNSLKNIQVTETIYRQDKIVFLRFHQK